MRTEQLDWRAGDGWSGESRLGSTAQLVLVFGARDALDDAATIAALRARYPEARLVGCSTAGEIRDVTVRDGTIVATAVALDHGRIHAASIRIVDCASSLDAGRRLAEALPRDELAHVLVLSDGIDVNGSELALGLERHLPPGVAVTGGLAADGAGFQQTRVLIDDAGGPGQIVVIGWYGARLRVAYGSLGGWDPFGPERVISRSRGNCLYELDGKPALELYKQYLGEHAAGLPATGLLFPLCVRTADGKRAMVRTILGVSEADQSMNFAGDMPEGAYARLMKANFDRLVDGAEAAATATHLALGQPSQLAILISCVGRKLVLKQRTEEEVESVRRVLGASPAMTGFYSYGEICPAARHASCELHNQTMTITAFAES